jgi:hypothetical protein
VITVRTLTTAVHSGKFGGAAPDALAAFIQMLATLRDEDGNTTVRGLDADQRWLSITFWLWPLGTSRSTSPQLRGRAVRRFGLGSRLRRDVCRHA